jgi:thiol-disulfide isomerase/thioredoxin
MLQASDDGFIEMEWMLKLAPARRPKAIDLLDQRTGSMLGIYQLENNTLNVCIGAQDQRPTEFSADPGLLWTLERVSKKPIKLTRRFPNSPGCFWMIEPSTPSASMFSVGIGYFYEKDRDDTVVITMACAVSEPHQDYRPVLFDARRRPHWPTKIEGGMSERRNGQGVSLTRWRMNPKDLPAAKVELIGIEAVTLEANRLAARKALEEARVDGIEVIPWPEIGKPYPFTLTTLDGRKIRSEDLKGKVVVLDCWATWCSPCLALMPELKSLYHKRHRDGLEIIGVSLDDDPDTIRKASKTLELSWPQVQAQRRTELERQLWVQASGIVSIPRILLIDRAGVLRADSSSKLADEVAKLLEEPNK